MNDSMKIIADAVLALEKTANAAMKAVAPQVKAKTLGRTDFRMMGVTGGVLKLVSSVKAITAEAKKLAAKPVKAVKPKADPAVKEAALKEKAKAKEVALKAKEKAAALKAKEKEAALKAKEKEAALKAKEKAAALKVKEKASALKAKAAAPKAAAPKAAAPKAAAPKAAAPKAAAPKATKPKSPPTNLRAGTHVVDVTHLFPKDEDEV